MQTLPYVVVTNPNFSIVYELYYKAFESLRRVPEIKTLDDNDEFCKRISQTLKEHLAVIPKLAMGVLECRDLMKPEDMDRFMNTVLRSVRYSYARLHQHSMHPSTDIIPENISPDHRRAAPRPDRHLQIPLALPRRQAHRVRICRRGLPPVQCQRGRFALWEASPGPSVSCLRALHHPPRDQA
jgi:hypothetical protein